MRLVISGANRGIGLELVRQTLARGDSVFAAVRNPHDAKALTELQRASQGRLTLLACDVGDDASVEAFARQVPAPLDALINNAGVFGSSDSLARLDFAEAMKVFSINALGPLRLTRALLAQLEAGRAKILHLTSGMGSIADNRSGGAYAYRLSKAALNMASRNLALELKSRVIVSAVINPGWVQTDMGGANAPTAVDVSAKGILEQLAKLNPATSGEFLDAAGKRWPW